MRALVFAVLLFSCRRDTVVTRPSDPEVHRAERDAGELPRVRVLADIAEHHGKRVVAEGLYEVEPIARGKGGKKVWIVLVDGTRISRSYALVAGELPYANRRVRATGTVTSGPPDQSMQALFAPHLAVEKLGLADGEPPLDRDAHDIPTPAVASTTSALAGQIDRWVSVVATLTAISADSTASLKLTDGGAVRVERVHGATWSPLVGKVVTVTGRLSMEKGASGAFALDLVIRGSAAICAGSVPRCGM